jgi:hypothetical protein
MKKYILTLFITFVVFGCEKPGDCIKSTGEMVTKEIPVTPFDIIYVYAGIGLVIKEGPEYKVEVQSGKNLIDDISVVLIDNVLTFRDETTCNWVRDYGETTVFITAPNLTEIHSRTEQDIKSDGVITFPILRFIAIDLSEGAGTGDFIFEIDNGQLVIENNNVSRFFISGKTQEALFNFYDGNGRIEAQNLEANVIKLFHRGSNDMYVSPIQRIEGELFSTGDVVLYRTPTEIDVTAHYYGQLRYN